MRPGTLDETDPKAVGRRAVNLFTRDKWNCAEAVCGAVAELTGREIPINLATLFGGGMGDMQDACGCLSGALLALGSVFGRNEPDPAQERRAVAVAAEFRRQFVKEYGSTRCCELTEGETADPALRRLCAPMVRRTAERVAEMIRREERE